MFMNFQMPVGFYNELRFNHPKFNPLDSLFSVAFKL